MRRNHSKADLWKVLEGRYPLTSETLALAQRAMTLLWQERQRERGEPVTTDRSNSCKFAALLARELFGGRLVGNFAHVFVLRQEETLDLNAEQEDVLCLGSNAHEFWADPLFKHEYAEALRSNLPRVQRWVEWFDLTYSAGEKIEQPAGPQLGFN